MPDPKSETAWAVRVVRELNARKEAQSRLASQARELGEAHERLRLQERALAACVNGVVITTENRIEYVNPAVERLTGYRAAELVGGPVDVVLRGDGDHAELEALGAAVRASGEGKAVVRTTRKDGAALWLDLRVAAVHNDAGEAAHFVTVLSDVTETRKYQQEIERQSNYDTLTGLPNRNLLADRIERALAVGRRDGSLVGIAVLDLDHFKKVNSLGLSIGDHVLTVAAERLAAGVRETDTVARLGADEFAIVLPGLTDSHGAARVAGRLPATVSSHPEIIGVLRRVQQALGTPVSTPRDDIALTCSIGLTVFPHDGADVETLLGNAEAAMHRAKELGRNCFQFYSAEMTERTSERLSLEVRLRRALEQEEFVLHYQPKVELASGRITGIEALIRWNHPERGLLPPSAFLPVLEETGLIVEVGRWGMQRAAREYSFLREAGHQPPRIAVNLSALQLKRDDFVATVASVIDESSDGDPGIDLEITESLLMENIEATARKLKEIQELGIGIAIDDFGTGYSSLSYLAKLPVDVLKIDRAFISALAAQPDDTTIVSTIIKLAHSLELTVVAEGVEAEHQARLLHELRCDEIQGYLLTRPLPFDRYVRWAKAFSATPWPFTESRSPNAATHVLPRR